MHEDGERKIEPVKMAKEVVWVYLGDYECTKVGRIGREEWGAQKDGVSVSHRFSFRCFASSFLLSVLKGPIFVASFIFISQPALTNSLHCARSRYDGRIAS